jgi:bacterioferritin-associated ferredoxin
MYVCVCGAVTERHIRSAVRDGVVTYQQLRQELPVARCCGRCKPMAKKILAEAVASEFPALPNRVVLPSPLAA